MPVSNYPGGFANGISLRNKPIYEPTPRDAWYVDSNAGSDDNSGKFNRPFATLNQAVAKAAVGDTVYIAPNHVETVVAAGGVTVSCNGVNFIGLGNGVNRPVFNYSTATTATFIVSGANNYFENLRFRNVAIDNLATMISVTGARNVFNNCQTVVNNASFHTDDVWTVTGNGFQCMGYTHDGRGGATGGISIFTIGAANDCIIQPRRIVADCSTALIENTAAASDLYIFGSPDAGCHLENLNSADVIVTCHSSTTGAIGPNMNMRLADDAANITEALVMAAGVFYPPLKVVNAAGQSAMEFNATATTDA